METINYILNEAGKLGTTIWSKTDSTGVWANFFGGLGVVLFLFIWNEIFRPNKNLSGEWDITNKVKISDYKPYVDIEVIWKMYLLQNGSLVSGSGEKIKEINSDGTEYEYEPENRDSVEIQGYIEKNYIRKSRVFINVIQVGRLRRSRATYVLKNENDSKLVGTFVTTAGNTRGTSIFIKNA